MATEPTTTQTTIPGTAPAEGGEAEAVAKAAADAAAAKAIEDAKKSKAAADAKKAGANGKPKGGAEIRMPSSAFRERIDREAAAKIKKALGCTLEEAQEMIKAQRAGGGAAPAPGTAAAPAPGTTAAPAVPARPNAEIDKLRRQNQDLERRTEALRAKVKKVKTRARDRLLETELRYSAVAAGIKADDADYAMGLYRAKVRATPQGEDVPDPDSFWPTLKATKGYLFVDGAPAREVSIKPTTAPPASRKPGEEVPPARGAGAPATEKGVMEMESDEFGARTSARYGYRPPQSA